MCHFWAQNGLFAPNKFFFLEKIINIIFIYLFGPFHCAKFQKKNSYSRFKVKSMHLLWAQNGPFA